VAAAGISLFCLPDLARDPWNRGGLVALACGFTAGEGRSWALSQQRHRRWHELLTPPAPLTSHLRHRLPLNYRGHPDSRATLPNRAIGGQVVTSLKVHTDIAGLVNAGWLLMLEFMVAGSLSISRPNGSAGPDRS